MLNKYINSKDFTCEFLKFSLFIISCYCIVLTLFITMPPNNLHNFEVLRVAFYLLESIFSSITLSVFIFYVMSMINAYYKFK